MPADGAPIDPAVARYVVVIVVFASCVRKLPAISGRIFRNWSRSIWRAIMSKITGYDTHDDGPGFVGIRFCQECNNMLYPKEDKENKVLMYAVSIYVTTGLAIAKRGEEKKKK